MKIKKFCATATLLAAACAMQAGALAAEAPAATGTATQSTVGTAVTATNQTANTDAATGEPLIGATVHCEMRVMQSMTYFFCASLQSCRRLYQMLD